ncbi:hypothetical protein B0H21DRAFT_822592 [Amylocystis lapponica]|nr:hypothetical protein B0H21DRAFT_822592 [Amylocystis lapponica]
MLNRAFVFIYLNSLLPLFSPSVNAIALAKDRSPATKLQDVGYSNTSSAEGSSASPPSFLPEREAMYYAGLLSSPRLLARTGTTPWEEPKGPEAYPKLKQLGAVFNHKLSTVWEDVLPKILACLDGIGIKRTSVDLVRIGLVGEYPASVVLWIGAKLKILAREDANKAAFGCLEEFGIGDVDVELRESRSPPSHLRARPPHLCSGYPYATGTGGFFMAEKDNSDKLLPIATRHVVLPPNKGPNDKLKRRNESEPRFNVVLLGKKAYDDYLMAMKARIGEHLIIVEHEKLRIKAIEGQDDEDGATEREEARRVLGHVVCSPPIHLGVGTADEMHTEDYAIIKVDDDKVNKTDFKANDGTFFMSYQSPSEAQGHHPGRGNALSYVREYFSHQISKDWPILPYDIKSRAFSAPGDSGAVVVDGIGRVSGLLTGATACSDISYATPNSFLLKSIKANGYPTTHPLDKCQSRRTYVSAHPYSHRRLHVELILRSYLL